MRTKLFKKLQCMLGLCSGQVEHSCDQNGVWWIGLRCNATGKLHYPIMSANQDRSYYLKRIETLEKTLRDANEVCRSSYQIASRNGEKVDWVHFTRVLGESLDRQHKVMYPKSYE